MHVLPLPFGMALAVLPRREALRFDRPAPPLQPVEPPVRDRIRSETRYAEFRQRFV